MKYAALIGLLALAVGCSNVTARSSRGNNRDNNNKPGTGTGTGSGKQTYDPDKDQDLDGYTPNQGDCDDTTPLVNPGAAEVIGNNYDDDCDGEADEVDSECESLALGKTDPTSLAEAMGLCNPDFLLDAKLAGPADVRARAIVDSFGVVTPQGGGPAMIVLSSGIAADANGKGFQSPQSGVTLSSGNSAANPAPDLPVKSDCGQANPSTVNDYTELVLKLRVPSNANSFSFNSHFLSAEYPEFVCTSFNDAFVVLLDDGVQPERNIVFDDGGNPISVNNGFFRVCENYSAKPQTQNCTRPLSEIAGTGFEETDTWGDTPVGGSTGWLKTSAPVSPGTEIKLRFIIWDASDHIYDSTVLIDNFQWSVEAVDGPITIG